MIAVVPYTCRYRLELHRSKDGGVIASASAIGDLPLGLGVNPIAVCVPGQVRLKARWHERLFGKGRAEMSFRLPEPWMDWVEEGDLLELSDWGDQEATVVLCRGEQVLWAGGAVHAIAQLIHGTCEDADTVYIETDGRRAALAPGVPAEIPPYLVLLTYHAAPDRPPPGEVLVGVAAIYSQSVLVNTQLLPEHYRDGVHRRIVLGLTEQDS